MQKINLFWQTLKNNHQKHHCDSQIIFDVENQTNFETFCLKNVTFLNKMLIIIDEWTKHKKINEVKKNTFFQQLIVFYLFKDKDIIWNLNNFSKKLFKCINFNFYYNKNCFWNKNHFNYKNQTLSLNDDENLIITKKFKNKAIIFGNLIKEFLKFFIQQHNNESFKKKAYYLGYYLSMFVLLQQFNKSTSEAIKQLVNSQNMTIIKKIKYEILFSKLFVKLKYVQQLKNFFPKKFNYLVIKTNQCCRSR